MATITVLDSSGTPTAIEKPLTPGRAAAASSRPMALSTEDLAAVTLITSGAAGSLGKAEDAAHGSGDIGVMALAVQKATPVNLGADGDYAPLQTSDGLLNVKAGASEAHIGQTGGTTVTVDVTLSLDTNIYASGDVLADTQQVDAAMRITNGTGVMQSIVIVDQDDQKAAFTIYFLNSNVAMGTENSAPGITDANALFILGRIKVAVADYDDLGGVSVAMPAFQPFTLKAVSATDDIYVAVVNGTGTPTYTAAGVKLRLGILQD